MEESSWPSKCRNFEIGSSLARKRPRETWSAKRNLKEQKGSKELVNNMNVKTIEYNLYNTIFCLYLDYNK